MPEVGAASGSAILWIHGGGWFKGDKRQFAEPAAWFCERGFVCASMKYHLTHEKPYPAAIEDARLAMQFLKRNAHAFGFDPGRIAAAGSSAGGYLAAMLALIRPEDRLGSSAELTSADTRPAAAILYCPVTAMHEHKEHVRRFLGCVERENPGLYREASPIGRIRGGEPPFLIVQGDADAATPLEENAAFRDRLTAAGVDAELAVLPGVGHGFGYGVRTDAQKAACAAAYRFLRRVLA